MSEREFHDQFFEFESDEIVNGALSDLAYSRVVSYVSRKILNIGDARLLSLGSGRGELELRLSGRAGSIVGIDISPVGVRLANEAALRASATNVTFETEDALALSFEDDSFDSVIALGFLHHIPDQDLGRLLCSILRVLKPGGRLISIDPNAHRMVGLFKFAVRSTFDKYHSPDERELLPRVVRKTMLSSGFSAAQIDYVDFFMGPLSYLWPHCPRKIARTLLFGDSLLTALPIVRMAASAFSVVAER